MLNPKIMPSVYVVCGLVVSYLLCRSWINRQRRYQLPPGPRGLPLFGNVRDVPAMPTWVTYREWSVIYSSKGAHPMPIHFLISYTKSPIIHLNVLGQDIVILNTLETVMDLLDKRSAIYSDRPALTMITELCGFGWGVSVARYGREWRIRRKAFHSQFGPHASERFRPLTKTHVSQFLLRLLEKPEEYMAHVRHMIGSHIIQLTYGIKARDCGDPFLRLAHEGFESVRTTASVGMYMVDMFPILKHIPEWFPGANFKRQAKMWRSLALRALNEPYYEFKRLAASEDRPECVAMSLVEIMEDSGAKEAPFDEDDIKAVLATTYGAGFDTTISTVMSWFLAMTLYPDVQAKAQAELDRVCPGRLPTFVDYNSLPYIQAIVKESHRWNPVVPESLPHCSTEDDVYNGYFIPKGSIIVPNSWAILHDEEHYPDPSTFNPDRFIKDGALNPDVLDPTLAAFGYGRRMCPGRFLANDTIWLTVACILATFQIRPATDEEGHLVIPTTEYDFGFTCIPKPFRCEILPRSQGHAALVSAASSDKL